MREAQASDSDRHGFSLGFGSLLGVCPWLNLFASLSLFPELQNEDSDTWPIGLGIKIK